MGALYSTSIRYEYEYTVLYKTRYIFTVHKLTVPQVPVSRTRRYV